MPAPRPLTLSWHDNHVFERSFHHSTRPGLQMKTVISVNFIFCVFCISYFLIMVVKTPHSSNRKEGFILAYTLL